MDSRIRLQDRQGNTTHDLKGLPVVAVDTSDGPTFVIESWLVDDAIEITASCPIVIEPMSGNRIRITAKEAD